MKMFRTLREKKTISNYVVTKICLLHLQLKEKKIATTNNQINNKNEMKTEEKHTKLSIVTTIRTSLILPTRSIL